MVNKKDETIKDEILIDDELKKEIMVRLRRVEGQVKGIQGMIDKDICCRDVLTQIAAIKAAINKVGILMIEDYAKNCMGIKEEDENYAGLERLIKTLNSFVK